MDFRKYLSAELLLLFFFLLIICFLMILSLVPVALGADLNCTFKFGSCTGSEIVVFTAEDDAGISYNNSHVAVNNQTAYAYSLCCLTDGSHNLNASCSNSSTSSILIASGLTNAHVQIPAVNDYNYDICLGADYGSLSCEYVNTTCTGGYSPLLSMASSGATNVTNAHVGNYSYYTLNVCCQIGDSPPDAPILLYPVDDNQSVFERNVTLNWTVAFEPDGDSVTYNVSLNVSSGTCSVQHSQEMDITPTNFTTDELCHDPQNYTWSVQACDKDGCSDWATAFFFEIESVLGITFKQDTTDFGSLGTDQTAATDTSGVDLLYPFTIENDGNIYANISLRANQSLFENIGLDNTNFRYRAEENETNSYTSAQVTYTNVLSTYTELFNNLSYIDPNDDGLIHTSVTVPFAEPAGTKVSQITVRAEVPP